MNENKQMIKLLKRLKRRIFWSSSFSGMCISSISMSWEERELLDIYLRMHRPEETLRYGPYWWKMGYKKPRLVWLRSEIKRLKALCGQQ